MINLMLYMVVSYPAVMDLMADDDFDNHAYPILDNKGIEDFGSSAWFVEKNWAIKVLAQAHVNKMSAEQKERERDEYLKQYKAAIDTTNDDNEPEEEDESEYGGINDEDEENDDDDDE